MGSMDGKVALVTGSTQGVGEATARRFAAEGASGLVVCGRSRERGDSVAADLCRTGVDAVFVPAELEDQDSCHALVAESLERFGRIDTLVNAAGLSLRGSIIDSDVELFDRLMAVNARAPLVLIKDTLRRNIHERIDGTILVL
jgi:NAD(P)-dependent dehydrogenase (short-subunit alcohol dehydrogenase family)